LDEKVLTHTKFIRNLRLPKLKQGLNVAGRASEGVRKFKYLGIFIIGKK
jgi:hypothetical protein